MTKIFVTTKFEGIHCYPDAPKEVSFLRSPHRHIFHVKAEIQVFHDDRELEFIIVKRDLDHFISHDEQFTPNASCEMMASVLVGYLENKWPLPNLSDVRFIAVTVSEDGENGAYVDNQ